MDKYSNGCSALLFRRGRSFIMVLVVVDDDDWGVFLFGELEELEG